ncbi:hypothetical protein NQ318_002969 [Aromia moschata]|uniref:DUF4817 domain-containing protein n=1 Tax=Aromia moschata TaxID=1265417 RepID=A0AAV8YSB2_9CUCU|nr:hypothetical protein NQ318_002969 [Aromia moschata]
MSQLNEKINRELIQVISFYRSGENSRPNSFGLDNKQLEKLSRLTSLNTLHQAVRGDEDVTSGSLLEGPWARVAFEAVFDVSFWPLLPLFIAGDKEDLKRSVYCIQRNLLLYTPVSQGTICQLIKKFRETGKVKDVKRTGRPISATSEDKALNVLLTIEETPQVSTRVVADNLEISHVSVLRILKKRKNPSL